LLPRKIKDIPIAIGSLKTKVEPLHAVAWFNINELNKEKGERRKEKVKRA